MAGGPELFGVLCLIPEGKEGGKGLRDVMEEVVNIGEI